MDIDQRIELLQLSGLNLFASSSLLKLQTKIEDLWPEERLPFNEDQYLCLVAHGGKLLWEKMPSPPIDDYSIKLVKNLFPDAQILYPNNDHQFALQKIGRFFNMGKASALGIDINPTYGVWFAYRCLFLTKEKMPEIYYEDFTNPCSDCLKRPCLIPKDFQSARLSCPYKNEHQYTPKQLAYHQSQLPPH